MNDPAGKQHLEELRRQIVAPGASLGRLWGSRARWQISLRWIVPPAIALALGGGWVLGFRTDAVASILTTAVFVLAYNTGFAVLWRADAAAAAPAGDRRREIAEVGLDYVAMLALLHFTGGLASPLLFFFLLHVVIAAVLFRAGTAYLFAALATSGVGALAALERTGWFGSHPVFFRGVALGPLAHPAHDVSILVSFTAATFIVAAVSTAMMKRLRARVLGLAEASAMVARLNERLNSLYAMIRAIGSSKRLEAVLAIVTSELAEVMGGPVVTVKLLSEDGKSLRFVAAHGMPPDFIATRQVEIAQSPLNRRIIEGETLVFGRLGEDHLQLHDDFVAAGLQSVLLAPLRVEGRVTGILGAYGRSADHFHEEDTSLFSLAAELVAIAIEDARQHEAIETLMMHRTRFMLQVAHNLRSPLAAAVSMLEAMLGGYLGAIDEQQRDYLGRAIHRLRTMAGTVGELLSLAQGRQADQALHRTAIVPADLAAAVERGYRSLAEQKGLGFDVRVSGDTPVISGDRGMIDALLDNLISNAIKYTPAGGRVEVVFSNRASRACIEVRDTGIGIPAVERAQLFSDFFRASNARKLVELGTGLGLAIVKQIIDRHEGHIHLESEEGRGTTFVVELPAASVSLSS